MLQQPTGWWRQHKTGESRRKEKTRGGKGVKKEGREKGGTKLNAATEYAGNLMTTLTTGLQNTNELRAN